MYKTFPLSPAVIVIVAPVERSLRRWPSRHLARLAAPPSAPGLRLLQDRGAESFWADGPTIKVVKNESALRTAGNADDAPTKSAQDVLCG